jgi:hypothetical protein
MTMFLNWGALHSFRLALRASLVILLSMILLHVIIFKMKTRVVGDGIFVSC